MQESKHLCYAKSIESRDGYLFEKFRDYSKN